MTRPTLLLLRSLGASAREWDWIAPALDGAVEPWPLDLPGFGERADMGAPAVGETVDWLAAQVRARAPALRLVAGHAMGAKFATLLAARGEDGLGGLAAAALLAASPPAQSALVAQVDTSYLYARGHGVYVDLSFIGADFPVSDAAAFDTEHVRSRYAYGLARGRAGDFWRKRPPGAGGATFATTDPNAPPGACHSARRSGLIKKSCDIAIIGAGTAGLHAYKAAVAAGADVVVIERGEGGSTCTAVGCIPSKLLIAAGRAAADARRAGLFGVVTGVVGIDGAAVMNRVRAERDRLNDQIIAEYHDIPADHRLHGEARFTGPTTLAIGAEVTVEARAVIIATGSHPEVPDFLDPVRGLVHTSDTVFDIASLPASLAVIGAGALGIELAQAFARLGVAVTVLDKGEAVAKLGDPDAARAARDALSHDMTLRLGVQIEAAMADGQARLRWSGADGGGELLVDMVLAAAGRPPTLGALDLLAAGVPLDDKGVPVFDRTTRRCGETAVFVAGDADAWRPVLHEAARGGRTAGRVAAGGEGCPVLPALSIAFTEPNLVEVGLGFSDLPAGAIIGVAQAGDSARATIDGDDRGLVRLYADRDGALLGGTIVLTGGEHLGQALALAIDRGLDAATLADQAWYHPVLEEMLQTAARDVIRQLG